MTEKNFFLSIKDNLPKGTFIQKIENKFNSGFPDVIIINEKYPLFIELKSPTKGNTFKVEPSQISTHLRLKANNYVSFFLVRASSRSVLYLFEGGKLCEFLASKHLASLSVSPEAEALLTFGSLEDCLGCANRKVASILQRWVCESLHLCNPNKRICERRQKKRSTPFGGASCLDLKGHVVLIRYNLEARCHHEPLKVFLEHIIFKRS